MALRQFLGSVFFYCAVAVITVVMGTVCMPLLLLPRKYVFLAMKLWAFLCLKSLEIPCGIRHVVEGAENIPYGAAIVASKHQSAWETIFLSGALKIPMFVLKKELLNLPVMGLYMKRLFVPINRREGAKSLQQIAEDAAVAKELGGQIVIFPEGTRTAPGTTGKYNRGVAFLYESLNLPVVPVALNSGIVWPRNKFVKNKGVVTIRFLPAIPPGLSRDEFMTRLKDDIEMNATALISRN